MSWWLGWIAITCSRSERDAQFVRQTPPTVFSLDRRRTFVGHLTHDEAEVNRMAMTNNHCARVSDIESAPAQTSVNGRRVFFLVIADAGPDDDPVTIERLAAELSVAVATSNGVAAAARRAHGDAIAAPALLEPLSQAAMRPQALNRCESCAGVGFSIGVCCDCGGKGRHR